MDRPIFLLSLDTELIWGPRTIKDISFLQNKEKKSREPISALLNLFEKYKIPATWAIVGHLFLESCDKETCLTWKNRTKHGYIQNWYQDPYTNMDQDSLFYGEDIIEEILSNSINHEIGYHSFSHPRFTEISREMAEDEIKEGEKIEKKWGIEFKSFVYPSNEIAHVGMLKKYKYNIYRGKTVRRYDSKKNVFTKIYNGSIDKIIAPPVEPRWMNGIWEIQSSMLFFDSQIPQSLLPRVKLGLKRAIKDKKVFHIYLHPWNMMLDKRLESILEKILIYVYKKREEKKIEVMTMGELADYLNTNKV